MEITTLDHFAITEIFDLRAEVEMLKDENESLKKQCEANREYRIKRGGDVDKLRKANDEWAFLWNAEYKRAEKLQSELDRAIEQMAELESQMQRACDRYNALARETFNGVSKDFEPMRGSNGN